MLTPGRVATLRHVFAAVTVAAGMLLCWFGVSWAFQPGSFLYADELGNLPWSGHLEYSRVLHLLPDHIYNDRPVGTVLEFFLYQLFGFAYTRQVAVFLLIHFANCVLMYLLMRKLGAGVPVSVGSVAVFGTLATTAQTATYIGAVFDVLCAFFLLGSMLLILSDTRWHWLVSAFLYLLALRTKEFAIALPALLTVLLLARGKDLARRLWPHCVILAVFAGRYAVFFFDARSSIAPGTPYYMDFSLLTFVRGTGYYLGLIFGVESNRGEWLLMTALAAMILYALLRRRISLLFPLFAFVLTILPVSLLPNTRAPFYTYAPAIFLLMAVGLFLERAAARWGDGGAVFAGALLLLAAANYHSAYFQNRVHFVQDARRTCAITARNAVATLGGLGPASRVYISQGNSTAWLMTAGPCHFLRMIRHSDAISCVLGGAYEDVLRQYESDRAEKYLVEYRPDGSLAVRASTSM